MRKDNAPDLVEEGVVCNGSEEQTENNAPEYC